MEQQSAPMCDLIRASSSSQAAACWRVAFTQCSRRCALPDRPCDAARAKYALKHTVRTHLGSEDSAYQCMGAGEDAQGLPGVFLRKNVMETAGKALADNIQRLAPLLMPPSVKVLELASPE